MDEQRRRFLENLLQAAGRAADELRESGGDHEHRELIADIEALRLRAEQELTEAQPGE